MKITVAICTWNRCKLLQQCLEQMTKLVIPTGGEWELLVVNNNCTDATNDVVARYADRLPLRLLSEPRQGLSYARNTAVSQAKGDYIMWTDDDVLVDPDWLKEYVKATEEWPEATFFGGPVVPLFEVEPPRWIQRNLESLRGPYVIHSKGEISGPYPLNEGPSGANMAVKREILSRVPFNPLLGQTGANQIRNDEVDLFTRLGKLSVGILRR